MKKFTKKELATIKALAKRYNVDMQEAARMFVRRGY